MCEALGSIPSITGKVYLYCLIVTCICFYVFSIMDPSLLRERELFKKRALSTPVVEKRSLPTESSSSSSSSKKKKAKVEHGGSSGSKQNSG